MTDVFWLSVLAAVIWTIAAVVTLWGQEDDDG